MSHFKKIIRKIRQLKFKNGLKFMSENCHYYIAKQRIEDNGLCIVV